MRRLKSRKTETKKSLNLEIQKFSRDETSGAPRLLALDQSHEVRAEDRRQFRAGYQPATRAGRNGTIVDREIVVAVQAGGVPDPVEAFGTLVYCDAGALAEAMRAGSYGIRRNTERDWIPTPQIDHIERELNSDVDMDVGIEVRGAQNERSRIAVPAIADNSLEEGDLEGLADIIHPEA